MSTRPAAAPSRDLPYGGWGGIAVDSSGNTDDSGGWNVEKRNPDGNLLLHTGGADS